MVRFISSVLFGCFEKQRSSIKQPKKNWKEKVVPLTLTPISIWKE